MAEGDSREVLLSIYDLSSGLAAQLSKSLLGKQVNGVWHTGVVFNGMEYYFGAGVQMAPAGQTPFGQPLEQLSLGRSMIPDDVFDQYLSELQVVWTPESYSLFENNCNHFSEEVATFLTGTGIPEYIIKLPQEVLSTPFGQMMAPTLAGVQGRLNSPPRPIKPAETPFSTEPQDLTLAVTDSLRAAAATVLQDTGLPVDSEIARTLSINKKDDNIKRLHEASKDLGGKKFEVASSLGRTSLGRENTSVKGGIPGPGVGFPAPLSRRLTTARSGEIITRLGSGQFNNQSAPSPRPNTAGAAGLPPVQEASARRQSGTNVAVDGPKEPKDGTRAPPGPPSARNVGLNARFSYDLQRSNSGNSKPAKADFEARVRHEFASIMAQGGSSPNEAVAQAIRRANTVSPSVA